MNRTLYLLRHAKSSWDDPALPDHERPLASRGRRACALLADYLRREQVTPQLVLCSSSTRTRETLEGLAAGFGGPTPEPEVLIEDGLYGATAAELLARLQTIDHLVSSVLLIGHDPAIHELAVDLVETATDRSALSGKFPTGALATLAVPSTWKALTPGCATLGCFVTPKQLNAQENS